MEIKTLEVAGIGSALFAMRNPMNSWAKSDTVVGKVGKADKELSKKLSDAGTEHCKHLRMIMVWANITAPRYWWTEFDTYRIGVEKVSCSTMHKLMARPLSMDDFEHDAVIDEYFGRFLEFANNTISMYKGEYEWCKLTEEQRKESWRSLIQALPQSYLQTRTVMMSYAALRGMYRQRKGHKLKEWELFRQWVEKLPEAWMIIE